MVASNNLNFPTQRGRGFGASAQVIGKIAIPFLKKIIVPAAKRVGAGVFEFVVPEVADVVSEQKIFKSAAKSVGKQTLRKQLGGGKQKRSIPVKKMERNCRSPKDIFTNIGN